MKRLMLIVVVIVIGTLALTAGQTGAWGRWADGCDTPACHGSYLQNPYSPSSGPQWPSSLHAVHLDATYMFTNCDLCHRTGDSNSPWMNWSNGTSSNPGFTYGCMGCHGRFDGGNWPNGFGLIASHRTVTGSGCEVSGCHTSVGTPVAEYVEPHFYGSVDTAVSHSCNPAGTEDFSGDGVGLDNDGDGVSDGQDTDCAGLVFFDLFESGDTSAWN